MSKENESALTGVQERENTFIGVQEKPKKEVVIKKNTGKSKFSDVVIVKATKKHPTFPEGKEFKIHAGKVAYLTTKGYIEKK